MGRGNVPCIGGPSWSVCRWNRSTTTWWQLGRSGRAAPAWTCRSHSPWWYQVKREIILIWSPCNLCNGKWDNKAVSSSKHAAWIRIWWELKDNQMRVTCWLSVREQKVKAVLSTPLATCHHGCSPMCNKSSKAQNHRRPIPWEEQQPRRWTESRWC